VGEVGLTAPDKPQQNHFLTAANHFLLSDQQLWSIACIAIVENISCQLQQ
jgi:hypothetical protein